MLELEKREDHLTNIKIIGVGGAGGNAVNSMIENGLTGVEFIVANTDVMDLQKSKAKIKIQLGSKATRGLGTGANPDLGEESAKESEEDIKAAIHDADMVIIAAGMGGGTGTGAAPTVAAIARSMGILTLAIATRPFTFEGATRRKNAEKGIKRLREHVDTLILIPNDKLYEIYSDMMIMEAFGKADGILFEAAKAVSDIINQSGYMNVDFADVKAVMSNMGYALMGSGVYEGEDRAVKAARAAITNPLLSELTLDGCKALLINVSGGYDMKLSEFEAVTSVVTNESGKDANIITGLVMSEDMIGSVRVTIIATGVTSEMEKEEIEIPVIEEKPKETQEDQLKQIFARIGRTTDSIDETISNEAEAKPKTDTLTTEKYEIPPFLRKAYD